MERDREPQQTKHFKNEPTTFAMPNPNNSYFSFKRFIYFMLKRDNLVLCSLYFIRIYFIVVFACKRVRHRDTASECDQSNYEGVLEYIEEHAELG